MSNGTNTFEVRFLDHATEIVVLNLLLYCTVSRPAVCSGLPHPVVIKNREARHTSQPALLIP